MAAAVEDDPFVPASDGAIESALQLDLEDGTTGEPVINSSTDPDSSSNRRKSSSCYPILEQRRTHVVLSFRSFGQSWFGWPRFRLAQPEEEE